MSTETSDPTLELDASSDGSARSLTMTAYRTTPSGPPIVPATKLRTWMDATDERFAYRCLPLLIANQAGWFILNEHAFEAIWDGTAALSAIRIRSVGPLGPTRAVSHFGSGVLTFHIPYVFRTPPGYNLLVRGPANWPKDGIQALEGLVETDWAAATFTMNWKFTRARRWVRFEAGEPICLVVPQRRGELETFDPAVRDLAENPDLEAAHRAWSASRSRFLAGLRTREPEAVAIKWQKDYFQGRAPDGTRAAGQHQTVLKLKPFTTATPPGAATTTGDVPVTTHPVPRQKPDYRLERLGAEVLLYHPTRTQAIYLNETASIVWALCNGVRTTADIAGLLKDAFPDDAARIDSQVESILRRFVEQDVIELN